MKNQTSRKYNWGEKFAQQKKQQQTQPKQIQFQNEVQITRRKSCKRNHCTLVINFRLLVTVLVSTFKMKLQSYIVFEVTSFNC